MTHEEKWIAAQLAKCQSVNPSARIEWREEGEFPPSGSRVGYYLFWDDIRIYVSSSEVRYIGIGDAQTAVDIHEWLEVQKHERGLSSGKKSSSR